LKLKHNYFTANPDNSNVGNIDIFGDIIDKIFNSFLYQNIIHIDRKAEKTYKIY